mgnify:CR=1 FL=1
MNHNVFYHADLDGVFSAARLIDYLIRSQVRLVDIKLYPVYSEWRGEKFNQMVQEVNGKIYIVDYQYNSLANLWIDHHNGEYQISKQIFSKPTDSAFELVDDFVRNHFHDHANKVQNLMNAKEQIKKIDATKYTSISEPFEEKPMNVMRLHSDRNNINFNSLVILTYMYEFNINKIYETYQFDISYFKQNFKSALGTISKNLIIYNELGIVTSIPKSLDLKLIVFYANPQLKYALRVYNPKDGICEILISQNPMVDNKIKLNEWIKDVPYVLEGGGHPTIAGGKIKEESIEDILTDAVLTFSSKKEE